MAAYRTPPPQPIASQGELQTLMGPVAYGWAYLPQQPDERAIVELLADGYPIGTVVADLFDAELIDKKIGDGCHAFAFPVPEHLFEQGSRLTARFANLNIPLDGRLLANKIKERSTTRRYLWQVSNRGDLRIVGWIWDSSNPQIAQKISFYEGSQCIGSCIADHRSAELIEKGFGDGQFAFSYTLPTYLQDGQVHQIRVMVADKEIIQLCVAGTLADLGNVLDQVLQLPAVINNPAMASSLRALQAERETTQNYLPKSFDFTHYDQWYVAYGVEHQPPPQLAAAPRYLVIIDGDGDPEPTLASLDQQRPALWQVLCKIKTPPPRKANSKNITWVTPAQWEQTLQATLSTHNTHSGLVTWLQAGDTLVPGALLHMAAAFERLSDIQCAYSDSEGPFGAEGKRYPWCKPKWDPHLQFANGYASHLFVCRSQWLAQHLKDIRQGQDVVWCGLAAITGPHEICHVPEILYRHAQLPLPPEPEVLSVQQALSSHLPGTSLERKGKYNLVLPAKPRRWPKVSLIIPTRDRLDLLEPCLESLLKTDYPYIEVIVADNDSGEPETLRYLQRLKRKPGCKVVSTPGTFNYARINNQAIAEAQGTVIGLINNDIEATDPTWLKRMVAYLEAPSIGAVGAKLRWPNGMVQHAGVVTGLNGVAGHIGNNWFDEDAGYCGLNQITHRVSAATAACLLLRKSDYWSVGGLDATQFQVNFNDVDFCLKLREKGLEILWAADVQMIHHESASRGMDSQSAQKQGRTARETHALLDKWGDALRHDPYYNPNLNLDRFPYTGLAVPPRNRVHRS